MTCTQDIIRSQNEPTQPRLLPLKLHITPDLDDVGAVLIGTEQVTLLIREGEHPAAIVPWAAANLTDSILVAFCALYGIHAPAAAIKADPWRYAAPILDLVATPSVIPPQARLGD